MKQNFKIKRVVLLVFSLWGILGTGTSLEAGVHNWTGNGDGKSFGDRMNWDSETVPSSGDSLVLLPEKGKIYRNDLVDFYPDRLSISGNLPRGETCDFTLEGNPIRVRPGTSLEILYGQGNYSLSMSCGISGGGTILLSSGDPEGSGTLLLPEIQGGEPPFAGKWVLDRTQVHSEIGFAGLGEGKPGSVIPDAFTLKNGASLKNYRKQNGVPAWQGIVLGEGGGGFTGGWRNLDVTSFFNVDGPVSGSGDLLIGPGTIPVWLNATNNSYEGRTIVASSRNLAKIKLDEETEGVLVVGADGAIPKGNDVTVVGENRGVLELNGHSLELGTLELTFGGILRNSSATPVTVRAAKFRCGGCIEGNVTLECGDVELLETPDRSVWRRGDTFPVRAGETLAVTNMGLGGASVKLMGGTLSLPLCNGFAEGTYGEYRVGNDVKGISALTGRAEMGCSTNWSEETGFYYQSLWYLQESGDYSFAKCFDNAARLEIDRQLVLENDVHNANYRVNGVSLTEGWHEVRLWFSNNGGFGGPLQNWDCGLKWTTGGNPISATQGRSFGTESGAFYFQPNIIRPLYVGAGGGTVRRDTGGADLGLVPDLILYGGVIECGDNVLHDPLRIDGSVVVGALTDEIPVFDAELELPEGAVLTFRDRVWIRRMPTCSYRILPGTEVFLSRASLSLKDKVLKSGARICWASFNLEGWAPGECIDVDPGTEVFLKNATTWSGDMPRLDNGTVAYPNSFNIGEGARLLLDGVNLTRLEGRYTGTGEVRVTGMAGHTLYLSGDFSSFNGRIACETDEGMNIQIEKPSQLGSGPLSIKGRCDLYLWGDGEEVLQRPLEWQGNRIVLCSPTVNLQEMTLSPGGGLNLSGEGNRLRITEDKLNFSEGFTLDGDGQLAVLIPAAEVPYRLPGLSGSGHLYLDGNRTVELGTFTTSFSGELAFSEGITLLPGSKCAPNPSLWLDASKTDSLVPDSEGKIVMWKDRREQAGTEAVSCVYPYAWLNMNVPNAKGGGNKVALPPSLLPDPTLRPGRAVDFGLCNSGSWLALSKRVPVMTVVFLVGSQNGGGISFFADSEGPAIVRGGNVNAPITAKNPIYSDQVWANSIFKNSDTRVNGTQVNPLKTGLSGGYQIIATRLESLQEIDTLMKDSRLSLPGAGDGYKRSGGGRFAELIVFDRLLTDREVGDTEAYLAEKWLGEMPISKKKLETPSTILVNGPVPVVSPRDEELSLPSIRGGGVLVKEGEGSLRIGESREFTGGLEWKQGTLSLGVGIPEPAFWTDMTRTDSYGVNGEGKFYWRDCRWDGMTDYPVAVQRRSVVPVVLENALNGLPILNLGALSTVHDRGMAWDRELYTFGVFMVIGSQDSGGTILSGYNRNDFSKFSDPIYGRDCSPNVQMGVTRLDGRDIDGRTTGFSGGYQVLVSCPVGPIRVDGFAFDRDIPATQRRDGGQRLGEVLIFTNQLNAAQILKVERYLMDKWLKGVQSDCRDSGGLGEVDLSRASGTVTLVKEGNGRVDSLVGARDIVKEGRGDLQIGDASSYTGTVSVAAGSLALDTRASAALRKARFWVDASKAGSLTLSEDGTEVLQWRDCRGRGMYARRDLEPESTVNGITYPNLNPLLVKDGLNGLPVVDFGAWMGNRFLVWEGALTKIRTVFWVVGSQEGGGNLLGYAGRTDIRDFFRGGAGNEGLDYDTVLATNPLWSDKAGNPCWEVVNGKSRINGADVDGTTTGLSGQYDIVSLRTTGNVEASAFNMDRDRWNRNATGGQRLAEVIIFDIPLEDEEIASIEAYLSKKWGLPLVNPWAEIWESAVSVMLTPGTKLALGAWGDYRIRGVGGIGEVSGEADLTVRELAQRSAERPDDALGIAGSLTLLEGTDWSAYASDGAPAPVLVKGECTVPGSGILTLTGGEQIGNDPLLLLKAGTLEAETLEGWKVKSDDRRRTFMIERKGDALYLVSRAKGMVLILK